MATEVQNQEFDYEKEIWDVAGLIRGPIKTSEYLDYYNTRRIKVKLKDLPPAIHRQQVLSAA
mgnify:CR=1 FL=1